MLHRTKRSVSVIPFTSVMCFNCSLTLSSVEDWANCAAYIYINVGKKVGR